MRRIQLLFCVNYNTIQLVDPVGSDAGDISDVAGEREKPPKCGSLPRDAGDLAGLRYELKVTHFIHCALRSYAVTQFMGNPLRRRILKLCPMGRTVGV